MLITCWGHPNQTAASLGPADGNQPILEAAVLWIRGDTRIAPQQRLAPRPLSRSRRAPDGGFEHLANEALIGDAGLGSGGPHGIEQWLGQPHVDALALGLEFEQNAAKFREIVFRQIGISHELTSFFVGS